MEPVEVGKHLIIHPGVCHGEMTFKGTRIPVETVLVYLAKGWSFKKIRESWPEVKREAIVEAIQLATRVLLERYTPDKVVHEPVHPG
jgi:uncharacterized protein (DUF433 family)